MGAVDGDVPTIRAPGPAYRRMYTTAGETRLRSHRNGAYNLLRTNDTSGPASCSGGRMRLIAPRLRLHPAIARKILECLKLPAQAPPLQPASEIAIPPEPAAPDREAGWEFDLSPADEDPELA